MLKYREHDIHTSHAQGYGDRIFEVYLVSDVAGEVRNVWRFAKRHQAEWIIKDATTETAKDNALRGCA